MWCRYVRLSLLWIENRDGEGFVIRDLLTPPLYTLAWITHASVASITAYCKPMKSIFLIQRVFGQTLCVHPNAIRRCSVFQNVNL